MSLGSGNADIGDVESNSAESLTELQTSKSIPLDVKIENKSETYEFGKGTIIPCLRERIYLTFSDPTYSTLAKYLCIYLNILVMISMILICCESVAAWNKTTIQHKRWDAFETVLLVNFLLDFLIKLLTGRPVLKIITTKPDFTIDLLGLLPYFLEKIVAELFHREDEFTIIKVLKLLRMLRFFRLFQIVYKNFSDVKMFVNAVMNSKIGIGFLGMYLFGAGLLFASCVYHAEISVCQLNLENDLWFHVKNGVVSDEYCSVQNMFDAWWFTLVTMTTVGYGDIVMKSLLGKLLTVLIMLGSLLFLALPSAIFAANLTEMYLARSLAEKKKNNEKKGDIKKPVPSTDSDKLTPDDQNQVAATLASLTNNLLLIQQQQEQLKTLLTANQKKNN